MLITHHNKTFRNEHIILNDNAFDGCKLIDCTLECLNTDESSVVLMNCTLVEPEFIGDGWPYELIELLKAGEGVVSWSGPLGNKKHTLH